MSEEPSKEIVVKEPEIIAPASVEKTLDALKRFEDFKRRVLTEDDYVPIAGKKYIKKSGWLKYALACNISLEKREEREEIRDDGTRVYHYTYRAIAPSGRFADAVGSASSDERDFAHEIHDVRALAQTRAMERAVSNLVGGGELGAEELLPSKKVIEAKEAGRKVFPEEREAEEAETKEVETEKVLVRILQPVDEFVGADGRTYGPYKAEDVAAVPKPNALALIDRHAAVDIARRTAAATAATVAPAPAQTPAAAPSPAPAEAAKAGSGEIPLLDERRARSYGTMARTEDGAEIKFDPPIDMKKASGPVETFLYGRVLDQMKAKVESEGGFFSYEPEVEGTMLRGIVVTGDLDDSRFKELKKACVWAASRAAEKG